MSRLQEREGKKLSSLVTDRRLAVEKEVAAALATAGVIDIEEKRALGLVPARYPVRDPEPERRVREQLRTVLAGGTPRTEDATLLAILQGLGIAPKILADERGTLGRRELKRRIKDVSSDIDAGKAVARAVAALNTAVASAAVFPAGAGGGTD
jgi:hypothetical protein